MKKFRITRVHESGKKFEQIAIAHGVCPKAKITNEIINNWYDTNDRVKEVIFN